MRGKVINRNKLVENDAPPKFKFSGCSRLRASRRHTAATLATKLSPVRWHFNIVWLDHTIYVTPYTFNNFPLRLCLSSILACDGSRVAASGFDIDTSLVHFPVLTFQFKIFNPFHYFTSKYLTPFAISHQNNQPLLSFQFKVVKIWKKECWRHDQVTIDFGIQ